MIYDLIFLRLSGSAAVKSKNVCLQLSDNHTYLSSSGIVQLFTQPHPQKLLLSPYFSSIPPIMPKMSKFLIQFLVYHTNPIIISY